MNSIGCLGIVSGLVWAAFLTGVAEEEEEEEGNAAQVVAALCLAMALNGA